MKAPLSPHHLRLDKQGATHPYHPTSMTGLADCIIIIIIRQNTINLKASAKKAVL